VSEARRSAPDGLAAKGRSLHRAWRRVYGWRRTRVTGGGAAFTLGACAVGFAAMNTGNNLLYLLLGGMMGFIAVSVWFSGRMMRDLEVRREPARGGTVGQEVAIAYHVRNCRKRIPTFALEIFEDGLPESAFLPRLDADGSSMVRSHNRFVRRGIYPLDTVTLSTGFPFGLFVRERDLRLPGELVIWPRTDRPVEVPPHHTGAGRRGTTAASSRGARGEYRALHEYRTGDDARDIHWRSSARLRVPVVREYDAEADPALWIRLDTRGLPGEPAEEAVEVAASLAARATREGRRFGIVADGRTLPAGTGGWQLERALDFLARVDFRSDAPAPPPTPPGAHSSSVFVQPRGPSAQDGAVAVETWTG